MHPPSFVDDGNVLGRKTAPRYSKNVVSKGFRGFTRLSELQIPRYVLSSSAGESTDVLELHCSCDASQKAYGGVIYTRVVKDCNVEVNLLVSKSRVAPLTKITMPRLELLGALLAARLASKVKAIVDLQRPSKVFFWTDSKIILHWIKGSSKR
ncbi:hypothetical protein AVEN_119794-1 [Araneus ventricosus]|uniref:Uncharacterized protein n=1 Tax=Araneus ventricosus TaxID=182803 RepID=A0A4Y2W5G0_ARAVE|nr:hypothetical protein AVEN_119794-1 [Araneus ventricosus]